MSFRPLSNCLNSMLFYAYHSNRHGDGVRDDVRAHDYGHAHGLHSHSAVTSAFWFQRSFQNHNISSSFALYTLVMSWLKGYNINVWSKQIHLQLDSSGRTAAWHDHCDLEFKHLNYDHINDAIKQHLDPVSLQTGTSSLCHFVHWAAKRLHLLVVL